MCMTGTRHEFLGKYRVGVSRSGLIQAVDVQLYSDGGCSQDLRLLAVSN
jgi:xanthine dehydrogenase molybdopterin-binding subunit B